jgi:tetratricopeptide (TPR) repeat protein
MFCAQKVSAQDITKSINIDSMLRTIPETSQKVDFITDYLEPPENQYLENAENLANRAFEIAKQTNYVPGMINSMVILGNCYYRTSDYKKAMDMAQKAMEMSEDMNYDKGLAKSLSLIGAIYNALGDYDNSSSYFFKSLKLFEKLKDKIGISHAMGDVGKGFYNQQDHKKALEYFDKSLSIAEEINSLPEIKRQYNNIAVVYGDQQKYDTAIVFLNKAMEINIKLGDKLGQGLNNMNIGYDQMNLGKYQDALISFQKALDLFIELNNRLHIAECTINFGFCYYSSNETDKSIAYFKKALLEGQQNNYYRIINSAAEILSKIYTEKRDTINAYRFVIMQKSAQDSLYDYKKQKLLSKFELQYIYEKKEFQRKLDQQRKNNLMMVIIFSLVSGIIILGLLLSRFRLKSKFVILEKEKVESELNSKNRELTVNLISLIKKNEMLSGISNKLVQLQRNAKSSEAKEIASSISHELRSNTDDKMLNEFSTRFQEVHAGFYETLLQQFPDLTQNELKLCAFLRLNMSSKDISELTGQYPPSIDQARYRLRKKLGISNSETNLVTFLSQI